MKYGDFDKEWENIQGSEKQKIIEKANSMSKSPFFRDSSFVASTKLPFVDDVELLAVVEPKITPPVKVRFLKKGEEILKLDGSGEPIFEVLKEKGLKIEDGEAVKDYIRFYFDCVKGDKGEFKVIEDIETLDFSEKVSKELYENLKSFIKGVDILEKAKNDKVEARVDVLYSDCLYRSVVCVNKKGEIDVLSEEPRYTDLPIRKIRLR